MIHFISHLNNEYNTSNKKKLITPKSMHSTKNKNNIIHGSYRRHRYQHASPQKEHNFRMRIPKPQSRIPVAFSHIGFSLIPLYSSLSLAVRNAATNCHGAFGSSGSRLSQLDSTAAASQPLRRTRSYVYFFECCVVFFFWYCVLLHFSVCSVFNVACASSPGQ